MILSAVFAMDVEVTALAEDERVLCNKDDGFP
jgi:hypothetical protein